MKIESIYCPKRIEEKLQSKHCVSVYEVRQVFFSQPRIRFAEISARNMSDKERRAYGRK